MKATRLLLPLLGLLFSSAARAVTIDWVTVGDPGNTADDTTYGAVADEFRIMKYEFTNQQYTDFLNTVAATDTYSLFNASMGSNARGGITQSGASGSYSYAVRSNMGDKPVNFVSWFDAARVSNWLMNGATGTSSTETGAYTLVGGQTSGTAPAVNPGATFYIPTEDQWYKAAYYKGGSTSAGYWDYATQSDTAPTAVTADSTGIGSAGSTGNFANYNRVADWNSQNGNVTTVGTNGGASAYGAFDMSGNLYEWNDLTGAAGSSRGLRGGDWNSSDPFNLSSSSSVSFAPSIEGSGICFRLASPVAVPEPSTWVMGLAGIACAGWGAFRRRRAR
jgi:formylglycine-generating enzyme required for sulfatase activity